MKNKRIITLIIILFILSCSSKKKDVTEENKDEISYEKLGLQYAMRTKAILGKNLLGTIKAKGTEKALEFCNIKAYPLTDSMGTVLNAKIKRVSDKPRNPLNAANENELNYINRSKKLLLAETDIIPAEVHENNGKVTAYYPIKTNKMCMQCHGMPKEEITESVFNRLNALYPKDMAIEYSPNQLRGIWVIEMDKN